ncbi:MAG TPA: hypothetical protein VIG32_00600 [Candidatus Baltobacteraceae bacterium]
MKPTKAERSMLTMQNLRNVLDRFATWEENQPIGPGEVRAVLVDMCAAITNLAYEVYVDEDESAAL